MKNWAFLHEDGMLYWHYNPISIFILLLIPLNSHSNISIYFSNILIYDYLDTHKHILHEYVICMLTFFKYTKHFLCVVHRAIDNDLPSSLSKNDHKHQKYLISKINCGQEMENSKANLTTNKDAFQLKLEETQKLLEDQHLSSLQVWNSKYIINILISSNNSVPFLHCYPLKK